MANVDPNTGQPDVSANSTPRPSFGVPASPRNSGPAGPTFDTVNADYLKYLGRGLTQPEYDQYYSGFGGYNPSSIANSAEGLARANKNVPGSPGYDPATAVAPANETGQNPKPAPTTTGAPPPSSSAPPPPPPTTINPNGTFTDPATSGYEGLINALTQKLSTPYQAPDYQSMIDSMNSYIKSLQGPAYTPAQQDVRQTQALDPQERNHQAARRQVIERMGAQGIPPSSGIVEKALENVDNQYATIRANTQSSLATNDMNVSRQNQQQAAALYPAMVGLENQQYQGNLNNQMQGVNLAGIIPNMNWNRLIQANGLMGQSNPLGALQLQSLFQNNGYNQSSQFSSGLMQLLMSLMGG